MHILAVIIVDAEILWMDFHGVAKFICLTQGIPNLIYFFFAPETWSCKKFSAKQAFQNFVTHELSHFDC